jgi:hypothetical protein
MLKFDVDVSKSNGNAVASVDRTNKKEMVGKRSTPNRTLSRLPLGRYQALIDK